MTACVTGASSGIGREFAVRLAEKGHPVLLVARRKARLEELARDLEERFGVDCETRVCDLSDREQCDALARELRERDDIEVLVNAAGLGSVGRFTENDPERDLMMIDVNVRALHVLTRAALGYMTPRDRGTIINVASVAGLMPGGPYMAEYYATKSYAASLTRSVDEELREAGSRVRICALCPGPVDTEFSEAAGAVSGLHGITAERCVDVCLRGLRHGRTVIVPGAGPSAGAFFARLLPGRLMLKITAAGQKMKMRRGR